jgi:hypothetical protein
MISSRPGRTKLCKIEDVNRLSENAPRFIILLCL